MSDNPLSKDYMAALEKQLDKGQASYQAWIAPINTVIEEKMRLVNHDGYSYEDYQRDIAEVRAQQLAKHNPFAESEARLDELCPRYLLATKQQAAAIRELFSKRNFWGRDALCDYMHKTSQKLATQPDIKALRMGLAAASIEDCRSDYRDTLVALADLFVLAERAGIDPKPYFAELAALSNPEKSSGTSESMQDILRNFHNYAVVVERRQKK